MEERVFHIDQDGYQKMELTPDAQTSYTFHIDKRRNANLSITYSGGKTHLTQRFICEEGATLRVLIQNQMQELTLQESDELYQDATLMIGYLEMEQGISHVNAHYALKEQGANAHIMSACITSGEKHYELSCEHEVPHTKGLMENYAVIKEHANYSMKAVGKIRKGAHDSESHQASRVLTLSKDQRSEVIPLLLIDENEVKASHATTIGQPDENQLYYLKTRGLTRDMALGLLTIGYLLPITEILEDEELAMTLKNEIEMKVGLHA